MIIRWKPRKYKTYHSIDKSFAWIGGLTKPPIISNYFYHSTLNPERKYKATLVVEH